MRKALFLCCLFGFLLLFYGVWLIPVESWLGGDWEKHLDKSKGIEEHNNWVGIQHYPPLFHWIIKPFNFNERIFYIASCLLIAFAIPLLLFKISKVPEVVLFYFSTTTIYYVLEFGGYLPLMLAFTFFLAFVWKNDLRIRFALIVLSLLTHSWAFWLLLIYWLVELFFKANWKQCFPIGALTGCDKAPAIFEEPIAKSLPAPYNFVREIRPGLIISYFIRGFPFPFFIAAVYQHWKERKHHFNAMIGICLLGGFLNDRVMLVSSMLLLIGLARYYRGAPRKVKILMFVVALALFVYNFNLFHLFKVDVAAPIC